MCLQIVFKIVKRQRSPTQLYNYMTLRSECRSRTLRDRPEIHLPKVNSTICQFTGGKDWNEFKPINYGLMA